ncbi:MAG: oligosaccharide flippase family protein, partial [Longimicrobiales bacterium]
LRPTGFDWPRISAIREALAFGFHLVVTRLAWFSYSNADSVVAGKLLGTIPLGFYGLARDFASMPVSKISILLIRVTPAYFSAVQNQPAQLRRYLLSMTEGLAMLTFPAAVGLALVAADFVPIIIGEKWSGAVDPLRLMAIYASFRSVTPLLAQILAAVGDTRFAMRNSVLAAIVLPFGFIIGSHWGVVGIAASWIIMHPAVLIPVYRRVFRAIDLTAGQYFRSLLPATVGCVWLTAVVLLVRFGVGDHLPVGARFTLETAAGALAYTTVMMTRYRARMQSVLAVARS